MQGIVDEFGASAHKQKPWWKDSVLQIGPTVFIAITMVLFLMAIVWFMLRDMNATMRLMQENLALHHEQQRQQNATSEWFMKANNTLLLQNCLGTAELIDDPARRREIRDGCFKATN